MSHWDILLKFHVLGSWIATADDLNPALPLIRNIYPVSHSLGSLGSCRIFYHPQECCDQGFKGLGVSGFRVQVYLNAWHESFFALPKTIWW